MKTVLLLLVGAYVLYGAVMILLHPRFIYPFQPDDRVLPGFSRVELTASDGSPIFVQEAAGDGPVILYFMGNAGALPLFAVAFEAHLAAGRHVVAMEYRGGAGRPGSPSETVLKRDALTVADYALGYDKPMIVQGFSLGTGLATHVAAGRDAAGVVLTAPYDKLCRLMTAGSGLPACSLPFVQRWSSLRDAASVRVPILVLHGTKDTLIPPERSRRFAELPDVRRILIDGAAHNDIGEFEAHREAIEAFVGEVARRR